MAGDTSTHSSSNRRAQYIRISLEQTQKKDSAPGPHARPYTCSDIENYTGAGIYIIGVVIVDRKR